MRMISAMPGLSCEHLIDVVAQGFFLSRPNCSVDGQRSSSTPKFVPSMAKARVSSSAAAL